MPSGHACNQGHHLKLPDNDKIIKTSSEEQFCAIHAHPHACPHATLNWIHAKYIIPCTGKKLVPTMGGENDSTNIYFSNITYVVEHYLVSGNPDGWTVCSSYTVWEPYSDSEGRKRVKIYSNFSMISLRLLKITWLCQSTRAASASYLDERLERPSSKDSADSPAYSS